MKKCRLCDDRDCLPGLLFCSDACRDAALAAVIEAIPKEDADLILARARAAVGE